ncbi:MAG: ExbD/TolR family protein [Flavobacteriales bacterium]
MPKIKIPRGNPSLDMTPMVDLAFLLVTFFMLTASFRTDEAVIVDVPSSVSDKLLPDTNIMQITLDTAGRVFYNIDGAEVRRNTLLEIGKKYKISFTEDEVKEWELIKHYGHPINKLKDYLNASKNERGRMDKEALGIPADSAGNQLGDWISYGRLAAYNKSRESKLRYAIKADGRTDYKVVKKVFNTFEKYNIYTFSLITNLEQE